MTSPVIESSGFTEGPVQIDGRRYVHEVHTDTDGKQYTFEWLGTTQAQGVVDARAVKLNTLLAAKYEAELQVSGTVLPISKLKFRELFTFTERMGIDALHAGFETNPALSVEQKAALRTGLEDYRMAEYIARPFDARVSSMLDMYVAFGLVTAERKLTIVEAGNG